MIMSPSACCDDGSPTMQAVVSGEVPFGIVSLNAAKAQADGGAVNILGVTSAELCEAGERDVRLHGLGQVVLHADFHGAEDFLVRLDDGAEQVCSVVWLGVEVGSFDGLVGGLSNSEILAFRRAC